MERDAYGVLLPVIGEFVAEPWLKSLVACGTIAVLCGETRSEYIQRRMSAERRAAESADLVQSFTQEIRQLAASPTLIALDQEPWGIRRLHDLVPAFPRPGDLPQLSDDEIADMSGAVAAAAFGLGVNVFLSPVIDVLCGPNPWLEGRTLSLAPESVGRIAAAFVRGTQRCGVVAVAKHFPGHPCLADDPALHDTVQRALYSAPGDLVPFASVVDAGVGAIMLGPVVVEQIDINEPSSTSQETVGLLRKQMGFSGLIISDDLNAPSTTRGRSLTETAVASIHAGADLLLVPGSPETAMMAEAIAERASIDVAFAERLSDAAKRVRETASIAGQ
jgi:beta-N-acetylhexosaminidase